MTTITLLIKKFYFDKILSGEKTFEYRSVTPYYENLFASNPTHVRMHYQKHRHLLFEMSSLEIIDTPEEIKESARLRNFEIGERVFKIGISNPRLV